MPDEIPDVQSEYEQFRKRDMISPQLSDADMAQLAKFFISSKQVPKELKDMFWSVAQDRESALSNFTDTDIRIMMNKFEDIHTAWLMMRPDYHYNFYEDWQLTQLLMKHYARIKRSVGSDRERTQWTTQTHQLISSQSFQTPKQSLLGRVFGGKKHG
jgi:hypothetical protein